MKKTLLMIVSLWLTLSLQAQVSKTTTVTAGSLSTTLTATELSTITNLTLTGTIDARDFKTMRKNMPVLSVLNITDVTILEYTGSDGTYSMSVYTYVANAIPIDAFQQKTSLTSIYFPSSITTIKRYAFDNCSGLTSLNITPSITSIEFAAFASCTGLKSLNISSSVMSIGSAAFSTCTGLTLVNIPASVTSIGSAAFWLCKGPFIVEPANQNYSSLDGVLFNKDKTTLVQFPLSKSGSYAIPETVTFIDNYAMLSCPGLNTLILPSSITSIGYGNFDRGFNLEKIYSLKNIPVANLDTGAFNGVNKATCILYVPKGSKQLYVSATEWQDFNNIVEMDAISLTSSLAPPAICNNSLFSYTPSSTNPGVTFNWSRAAVAGISNPPSSGTGNPNETLVNNTAAPVVVNYVYTLITNSGGGIQNVAVTVNPTAAVPISSGDMIACETSPIQTLTAHATSAAGDSIDWYNAPTGGFAVYPTLRNVGAVTYYAESWNGSCKSSTRTPVHLTINATPAKPVTLGDIVEYAKNPLQTLTASATAPTGATIQWYTTPTGGSPLATTPTLNAVGTATYYAEAHYGACASAGPRPSVTLTIIPAPTVTDVDGNVYPTVTIGTQVWMGSNLKTTKYNDGTAISCITDNTDWANLTMPGYCWYNNDKVINKNTYGALYNWYTVNTGKLCPTGWHVPTDAEWTVLSTYLGGESVAGGKLKETSTSHWKSPNTGATNEKNFTALPGGDRTSDTGTFYDVGGHGFWWSSSEYSTDFAWYRDMYYGASSVGRPGGGKRDGFSIRCLRDSTVIPTISTTVVLNIAKTTATSGGNITFDGGAPVTARGVCWSTTANPTIANSKTADGKGIGVFTSTISELIAGLTYYARAYATNSKGTNYGNEVTIKIPVSAIVFNPNLSYGSVTDIEGNVYKTIQIGTQTWMAENLKTTKYNDNTSIPLVIDAANWMNLSTPAYCWNKNDSATFKDIYGALYNWYTVNTNKLCPIGWHVPTYTDWTKLTSYLGGNGIAGIKLKEIGEYHWINQIAGVTNESGFTALPGGSLTGVGPGSNIGHHGLWWSSTESSSIGASGQFMEGAAPMLQYANYVKRAGFSVRCISGELSIPTLTTNAISSVTNISACTGGNISNDGGTNVTNRGVCWNTSANPAIDNNKTAAGSGMGSFLSSLSNLLAGTTYYVRAFATNSVGTAYGNQVSFKTDTLVQLPTLTTNSVYFASTTATCGGVISSDNGVLITVRGVCWGKSSDPTVFNSKTEDGTGMGSFTSALKYLSPNTTYYVRAYAINSAGTSYGNNMTFITMPLTRSSVTDIVGNVYNTVTIGTQVWMTSNLKVSKYNDGTSIPLVTDSTIWANLTTSGYCWYNNDSTTYKNVTGALYNWFTVNSNKLCPIGWHLPSDVDWSTLTTFLGGENIAGGKLKEIDTSYWLSPNKDATNETNFTAFPGGRRNHDGTFYNIGTYGFWWSSTENYTNYAWTRRISFDLSNVYRSYMDKENGYSVRCLQDSVVVPTISTKSVSNITQTTAYSGGNITSDGGAPLTARGVCWSTSANPTIANSKTTDGSGTGLFTCSLTGLTGNTIYHVRAYAANGAGTSYGSDVTFTTSLNPAHFAPVWTGNGFDQMNINIYSARLDGVELEAGDEIGIFDGAICVGAATLTAPLPQSNILEMIVSKDDGTGNGYTVGDTISFKLYDSSKALEMAHVTAFYSAENPSWSSDGIFSFGATSLAALSVATIVSQDITMDIGWNIISTYVVPANSDLKAIFQTLIDAGKLKKVMDETGKTIENFGSFGGWKNGIGNLNSAKGYKVNVTSAATLSLEGPWVLLPFDMALTSGWNIISYPANAPQDAKTLVQPLVDAGKLKKIMDETGKTLENFGAFGGWKNNIGDFLTGKGYKINVTANCTLTIPASANKSATILPEVLKSIHFTNVFKGNGTDHFNVHLVNLASSGLQAGDEIGIFDGKYCVGSATIGQEQLMSGSISIPASCNEEQAGLVNGFTAAHPVTIQIYRENQVYPLAPAKVGGSEVFEKNGSLFLKVTPSDLSAAKINVGSDQMSGYPNPFSDQLSIEIRLTEPKKLEVSIYDLNGKLVRRLFKGEAGTSETVVWDGTNGNGAKVISGTYILKANQMIEKIVLKK